MLISGPCGVGKTAVAKILTRRTGIFYIDFDELGVIDMKKRNPSISPFSTSFLNLKECLPPIINKVSDKFILDIGGDSVFRHNVNNDDRLEQILWLKKTYSTHIVILTAIKNILIQRFISTKSRKIIEFDRVWTDWLTVVKPNWQRCADLIIDTSFLTANDTSYLIEEIQEN